MPPMGITNSVKKDRPKRHQSTKSSFSFVFWGAEGKMIAAPMLAGRLT
jgi:hypothetical protein